MLAKNEVASLIYAQSRSHVSGRKLSNFRVEIGGTPKARLIRVKKRGRNTRSLITFQVQRDDSGEIRILSTLSTDEMKPLGSEMSVHPLMVREERPKINSLIKNVFKMADLR
ncbi:MAG: hypothetical protein KBC15_00955 [Candidatus Levybacteria bacterium]|nr:hypothetical protein [Candidatus Levybacteria bacterium]